MERNAPDRLLTLTHARLRVAQGDLAGARRVLRAVLLTRPEHVEARSLLLELDGRADRGASREGAAPLLERRAADATDLSRRFREVLRPPPPPGRAARIRRLERWLVRFDGPGPRGGPRAPACPR